MSSSDTYHQFSDLPDKYWRYMDDYQYHIDIPYVWSTLTSVRLATQIS